MLTTECDAGDAVILSTVFSVAGVATDPTTISLEIKNPAGTVVTYTYAAAQITRTGVGAYTKTISVSTGGTWKYAWIGTGVAEGVDQGRIRAATRESAA